MWREIWKILQIFLETKQGLKPFLWPPPSLSYKKRRFALRRLLAGLHSILSLSIPPRTLSWPSLSLYILSLSLSTNSPSRTAAAGWLLLQLRWGEREKETEQGEGQQLPGSLSTARISPHAGSYDRHAAIAFHRVRALLPPLPWPPPFPPPCRPCSGSHRHPRTNSAD